MEAAFFDLDKTVIAKASMVAFGPPLLRAGMISRRGGWRMLRLEWTLQRRLHAAGIVGPVLMLRNIVVRGAFRMIPNRVLGPVYSVLFRNRAEIGATP